MKLFTHNMLTSKMIKNVQIGYPLKLSATEVKVAPTDYRPAFLSKMIPKVEWSVLVEAVNSISEASPTPAEPLPAVLMEDYEKNDEFMKRVHHALFELEVITGTMECPETGRKFPIQNGVPNMLVNEDEV